MRGLQKELEQQESDYKKRVKAMEVSISEYEKEVDRLKVLSSVHYLFTWQVLVL